MALLSKDNILKAEDLDFEEIEIKEWGGSVRVGSMTGTDRDAYEASIYDVKGKNAQLIRENFRAKLIARTLIDENGNRLFTEKEVNLIGKKDSKTLDKIFKVAQKLNGLSPTDEDEFVKNLEGEDEDGSTSTSPKS